MRNTGTVQEWSRTGTRGPRQSTVRDKLLRYIGSSLRYAILIFFTLVCITPLFWVIASSLKTTGQIAANPLGFPTEIRWDNYIEAWTVGRFGKYFKNSVIVSIPIVTFVILLASLAGYGLARLRFHGSNFVFILFLLGLMVPFQSIMIPLFYILKDIRFLGTYWAMIVPSIALGMPFSIFFMRAYFSGLPQELGDAAEIDGCNEFSVYWRVMLPLAGPAVSALVVLQFMGAWNAFLLPLIYMQKEEIRPLVLGLMFFRSRYTQNYPLTMAGAAIVMVPIVIVYLVFQRRFVQGLTAGGGEVGARSGKRFAKRATAEASVRHRLFESLNPISEFSLKADENRAYANSVTEFACFAILWARGRLRRPLWAIANFVVVVDCPPLPGGPEH